MALQSYDVRFRHVNGDIGPFKFRLSTPISEVKEKLFQEWPNDGPLSLDRPSNTDELRLICSGRFLEDAQQLKGLSSSVGPPQPDLLVTIHVVVRPFSTDKALQVSDHEKSSSRSCCVIC